ncbi:MAG: choice-of-anchor J domain-containing protein, partial [Saprospiraceae bacterium]
MQQFLIAFFALTFLPGAPAQILYQQDFENGFQDMLLIDNDGLTPAASFSSFTAAWNVRGDLLGNAAVSISWYDPAGQSDDWMITPTITGITAKTILEWDARAFEPSTPDTYRVLVSVSGTDIADFTDQLLQVNGEVSNGAYHHRYLSLDAYAGKAIHLAFVNISNDQYQLGVDNILVRNVPDVDAALLQVTVDPYVRTGVPAQVGYTIKNNGFQTIDTLVLNWSDGIHNFSETLTSLNLGFGEKHAGTFTNAFMATTPDEFPLTFTITSVGSHPDELSANNSLTATSVGVTTVVPRRVVGEEATGTWCGWCVRGAVFMEQAHQAYPDAFIPLAVHNGASDPMKNGEYDEGLAIFAHLPPFPSVLMDRRELVDPRQIDSTLQELQKIVAPVAVTVQATVDSLSHTISIQGKTTTYSNRTSAKYQLV